MADRTIAPTAPTPPVLPAAPRRDRRSGALPTARARRRYWGVLGTLAALSVLVVIGILAWDNPMPFGTPGFRRIAELRATSVVIIVVVAFCQALATVAFQTVTNNRIITPSIMGFESLYRVVQTGAVFFLGTAGITAVQGVWQFVAQVVLMVAFAALLYGWLLSGKYGNLQIMLLIGIILGGGLGALATFMQRLLTPTEFDVLTARLIGSIANADASYLAVSLPVAAVAGGLLWAGSRRLNVLALGREASTNLGLNHRRRTIAVLLLVAVLMAVSTSLIGPMTFFGFLVAMLAYQLADTHDHRYVFPVAWLTGVVVLGGGYFVLKHLFYAAGSVGVIIEIVGGTFFLVHILRKGRL
ncbi:iron chelate uptake ABC transporter family permease subunit [Streptomyces sp. SHP 1-2]|uniref:iron chelate uptake ABC transporter family permease subunit n=1 Tax=Streptomyces sp. SHP 1-2 TaxID=2769489 RepID=UPI0022384CB2|nr:iron chelate uptake ABC transporter family permease subunit [Streptomyces sp. SHP 1-2]MCW5253712.1 iron chelate uptake ABC transporter family permease subunit [Streptomyces sp. SHP 1-2]